MCGSDSPTRFAGALSGRGPIGILYLIPPYPKQSRRRLCFGEEEPRESFRYWPFGPIPDIPFGILYLVPTVPKTQPVRCVLEEELFSESFGYWPLGLTPDIPFGILYLVPSFPQNAAYALRFGRGAFFGIFRVLALRADTRHSEKSDERITVLPPVGSSFSGCGDTGQIIKIIRQRRTLTDKQ